MYSYLGIIFVSICIIYFLYIMNSRKEGLTNMNNTSNGNGIAGGANSYASNIKAMAVALTDELIISKYRKDYEQTIINMDSYVSALLLHQIFSMDKNKDDINGFMDGIKKMNELKNAKDSLNVAMKTLDSLG